MKVSVLIPAYRPTYLTQAIGSVLAQGFEDYELVICDDSGGEAVAAVVERFRDPRIRYLRTAGRTGALANVVTLWGEASTDLLKYLFDDDLLLPNALVDLVDQVTAHPGASLVFGHRDVIDAEGRVRSEPKSVEPNKVITLSRAALGAAVLKGCDNRIGELSNVLLNRGAGLELGDVLHYRGFTINMMGDMGLYLNAASKGPVVGVGRTVGQFRRHEAQNSSWQFNPQYSKAVCEWELFVRGEFAVGAIDAATALAGVATLDRFYQVWEGRLPELSNLRAELPRLAERIIAEDRDLLDAGFQAVWAEVDALIDARRRAAQADS